MLPSRTWVTSTQSSRCLERKPISKLGSRSTHRSAISASSTSLRAVVSFVVTVIVIGSHSTGVHHPKNPLLPLYDISPEFGAQVPYHARDVDIEFRTRFVSFAGLPCLDNHR